MERLEHLLNVSLNVFGWGFRVILKHILVIWRHISLNVIKSSCCWSLFRLFDIGRQTLIWLKFKKSQFEIEIYTMNIIPLSNVIELNIDSMNWILFRETIIDNDIKTSFFRMSHCHMQQYQSRDVNTTYFDITKTLSYIFPTGWKTIHFN